MAISEQHSTTDERTPSPRRADLTATEVGSLRARPCPWHAPCHPRIDQKDMRFLDYLLAVLESEARKIAEHSYH